MKTLTKLISAVIFAAGAATSIGALAQAMADGEVRKVDKDNKKITLKHGEIKSLDMPPMTMVFQVSDAALLDKLKPGDKVQFNVAKDGSKLTVTEIKPAK
ncbi:MAG: copper-binding protein [Ramlibacter sp.]|nr:copper-binding protein [Ramlibacter sp.]